MNRPPHGRIWTTDHDNWWQVDGRTDGPSILWTESDDRPRLFLIDGRTDGQKSVRRGLLPGSKLGCPAFSGGIWDCAYQITHENEIERFKLVYLRIVWSSPGQSGSNRLAKTIVGKIFQSWWCFYFRSVWEKIITLGWRWFFHDFHDLNCLEVKECDFTLNSIQFLLLFDLWHRCDLPCITISSRTSFFIRKPRPHRHPFFVQNTKL